MDSQLITAGSAQEDELVSQLNNAAEEGDINALYALLRNYPNVLEYIDKMPFADTPLHSAALVNQTRFASNIVNLKPSFAKKLNPDGFSPLHLASTNGHVEMVKMLLKEDLTLCLVKGREKMIPLHRAAMAGRVDILRELLSACPNSIKELTDKNETALHLALKTDGIDAFEFFIKELEDILDTRFYGLPDWARKLEILNWKDFEGNTILHLAVLRNQPQAVRLLFGIVDNAKVSQSLDYTFAFTPWRKKKEVLDVKMINEARDIIRQRGEANSEIEDIFPSATSQNRVPGSSIINFIKKALTTLCKFLIAIIFYIFFLHAVLRQVSINEDTQMEERDALLVVAGLIVTTTFQVGITPPGGLWQDDDNGHAAGTSILYTTRPYNFYLFMILNFYGFNTALILLIQLTKRLPFYLQLRLALAFMWFVYVTAFIFVMPKGTFFIVLGLLIFMIITSVIGSRFVSWRTKKGKKIKDLQEPCDADSMERG